MQVKNRARRRARPSLLSRSARLLVAALAVVLLATVLVVASLRWFAPPASAMMVLEPGPLREIHYRWVGRTRISAAAARAVIAAEDQKFLEHHGFDFASINDALEDYRAGNGLRGASTITQQVAKNLFLWPGRSFVRKGLEAYFTLLLETLLPKQRILEIYLNVAELGPRVYGVGAAAERLLGTDASQLTPAEAALLAAVLPNPKRLSVTEPSEYVRARQAEIAAQVRLLEERGHYHGLDW
ncbi:MAG TPA: monofunctional biosynthetic peptidoglycan transglycosylase [Gammaproteobacteria bacterium]|nr:monofunctional biosynthetic peptidoglycan transglycosylase [Gammaproteobacteria bacterium]